MDTGPVSGQPAGAGVAELHGPYGPLQILEGRIQEVWALQAWLRGEWRTRSGKRLAVRHPGHWNRGAGPDFRDAVLELNGAPLVGDIEIHLYREDWWRHGHDRDPGYDRVVLHVVLFAGGMERFVRTASGSEPEEWIMGPWLREDVESVSGGQPGLFGELIPELREWLESESPESIRQRLLVGADRRWQAKEAMARCLLLENGWSEALHRMVLYYLGFPHNRRAFFGMAAAHSRPDWQNPDLLVALEDHWRDQVRWGVGRPANRARVRLAQYLQLNADVSDWPDRLANPPEDLLRNLARACRKEQGLRDTRLLRKGIGLSAWQRWIGQSLLAGLFSTGLVSRLWVDVLLPMLAAADRIEPEAASLAWFHWPAGDYPQAFRKLLRLALLQGGGRLTACNGWIQGLLWMEDQARIERIRLHSGFRTSPRSGSGA